MSRLSSPALLPGRRAGLAAALLAVAGARADDAGSAAVGAARDEPPVPGEIVVIATLRADTTLKEIPASIALLDSSAIRGASLQHFEELAPLVPNFNWSGEGSRARYFQVRGSGELEQYEGAPNASVGFIVDDIDFSALGGIATTFDVGRVEVLRGPQGTRYGASALAGLVYVQSAPVPDGPELYAQALAGTDGAWSLGAAAGGPVPGHGQSLGARLAVQQYRSDGFRHDAWLGRDDTNRRDELTARGKLRWRPVPGWQADLTGILVDVDNGYDAWAIDNSLTTQSDRPGRDAQHTTAGSVRVTGALGDSATLVSITGAADSDIVFSFDADWGNPSLWAPDIYDFSQRTDRERRTLNQELRLVSAPSARLPGAGDWVIGVYALDLEEHNRIADRGLLDVNDDFCADPGDEYCAPFTVQGTLASDFDATSLAVFGEASWPLDARTRLTLGLRGERRNADYRDTSANSFSPTDRLWGGEIALRREISALASVYARVARGYRAGGFNPSLARVDPADDQVAFGPEALWSYEGGLRLGPGDGAWWAALDLFWQHRDQMQAKVPLQFRPGDPNTFIFLTDNAESGRARGAEAELAWTPAGPFSARLGLGLLDTEITRFSAEPAFEGHDFPHAPHWSFALTALYEAPRGWFARADCTGRGPFYFDYDDSRGDDRTSDSATVVSLRGGRQWDHWRAEAWVRNLFDEGYAVRGFYFGNEPPAFEPRRYVRQGDPRQVGFTFSWRM